MSTPKFSDLKLEKLVESKLKRHADYKSQMVNAGLDQSKLRPGFYTQEDKEYLILPVSWLEARIIGHMVWDLTKSYLPDVECRFYDGERVEESPEFNESFLLGFWNSFYSDSVHKRSRLKKDYELGQTHGQCLMVKHLFQDIPTLGLAALVKDNFFFGNASGEKVKGTQVAYDLAHKLGACWKDDKTAKEVLTLMNRIARAITGNNFTPEKLDEIVAHHIVPFDEVVTSFKQALTITKRGKPVNVGSRTPQKPRSSPLLIKGEAELIAKLTSPFWENLDTLRNDWVNVVSSIGFTSAKAKVADIMHARWQILQKFAKMTTKRLQEVRATDPASLKSVHKANITADNVSAMLMARAHPIENFYREVLEIIPPNSLTTAITEGMKEGMPKSFKDSEHILKMSIARLYLDSKEKLAINISMDDFKKEVIYTEYNVLEKTVKSLTKLALSIGEAKRQVGSVSHATQLRKLPGKLAAFANIATSITNNLRDVLSINEHYIELVQEFNVLPNCNPQDLMQETAKVGERLQKAISESRWIMEYNGQELSKNDLLRELLANNVEKAAKAGEALMSLL
jgi:hypothetical protein